MSLHPSRHSREQTTCATRLRKRECRERNPPPPLEVQDLFPHPLTRQLDAARHSARKLELTTRHGSAEAPSDSVRERAPALVNPLGRLRETRLFAGCVSAISRPTGSAIPRLRFVPVRRPTASRTALIRNPGEDDGSRFIPHCSAGCSGVHRRSDRWLNPPVTPEVAGSSPVAPASRAAQPLSVCGSAPRAGDPARARPPPLKTRGTERCAREGPVRVLLPGDSDSEPRGMYASWSIAHSDAPASRSASSASAR